MKYSNANYYCLIFSAILLITLDIIDICNNISGIDKKTNTAILIFLICLILVSICTIKCNNESNGYNSHKPILSN